MPVIKLDAVQTLALAALVYFLGAAIRRHVPFLVRFSIPAPVVGGLLFAVLATALRLNGVVGFEFEETLQRALMIMFFTTIGLGASATLVKKGGGPLVVFFGLACLLAVLQNVLGIVLAKVMGINGLYGILAGAVSLMGGLGTAGAFGPEFEAWGVAGGTVSAIACATFGMVAGSLLCGPFGETVIRRFGLSTPGHRRGEPTLDVTEPAEQSSEVTPETFLRTLAFLVAAMALGAFVSAHFRGRGFTLPVYIGSMMVAVVLRNGLDLTGFRNAVQDRTVGLFSEISLALYITMAVNGMKLWELVHLALPLLVILAGQIALMALFCYVVVFRLMGRDYEGMMLSVGMIGFGLGATPNALLNMNTLAQKYGPAPRAFLIIPLVGAFLIDFADALIIMTMGNWLRP